MDPHFSYQKTYGQSDTVGSGKWVFLMSGITHKELWQT